MSYLVLGQKMWLGPQQKLLFQQVQAIPEPPLILRQQVHCRAHKPFVNLATEKSGERYGALHASNQSRQQRQQVAVQKRQVMQEEIDQVLRYIAFE
jgi:hypothetical protein